ncbi:hypothetical protein Tco_0662184 [Tanacetum coccineum]
MTELILNERMEKAQTESSLAKPNTDDDMNIELSKKFLMQLRRNSYYKTLDEDVVDHIAKVLKMLDLIKIPNVDSHRLRMMVFPLSLADDARQWWIDEGDGITNCKELVEKFFYRFYPQSRDDKDEMLDEEESDFGNSPNTTTDPFFKPYLNTQEKGDIEKVDEQSRMKPEKFEAIKYSLGPNEEYIAIRSCEYNAWERNEDSVSHIYQDIFQKKDKVARARDALP